MIQTIVAGIFVDPDGILLGNGHSKQLSLPGI